MFYIEDKIEFYPAKSGLKELLERDGEPGKWDVMPFAGCAHIKEQQLQHSASAIDTDMIVRKCVEFNVHKAKATDDAATRDLYASEITDYSSRLEDISQDYIDKYVTNQLIGFKINNTGMKDYSDLYKSNPVWSDPETGALMSESDILIKTRNSTTEEILQAKSKLPYLLKQLQQGSISKRGSLLSFIIAAEKLKYTHKEDLMGYDMKPSSIVSMDTWAVNAAGDITTKFRISQNNSEPLRGLIAWIKGQFPNDIYYKAYKELLEVCSILEIDLKTEDARNYGSNYMRKVVCSYLASNEEYLESYGYVDPNIISKLKPEELFSVSSKLSEVEMPMPCLDWYTLADRLAVNISILEGTGRAGWAPNPKAVNKFLEAFCMYSGLPVKSVSDYKVKKGLLAKGDGSYVIIPADNLINILGPKFAVISTSGNIVFIEDFETGIRFINYKEAISYLGKQSGKDWHIAHL